MIEEKSRAHQLARDFAAQSLFMRVALAGALAFVALSDLYGGWQLTHQSHHWMAWAITLLVLEPVGVFAALALAAILAPDSLAGSLFDGAMQRAFGAILIVGIYFAAIIVWLIQEV